MKTKFKKFRGLQLPPGGQSYQKWIFFITIDILHQKICYNQTVASFGMTYVKKLLILKRTVYNLSKSVHIS